MNFKQIQLVFIIAFVTLDIFLMSTLLQRFNGEQTRHEFSIQTELKKKNIQLKNTAELSENKLSVPYVTGRVTDELNSKAVDLTDVSYAYDAQKRRLTVTFNEPIPLDLSDNQLTESDLERLNSMLADHQKVLYGQEYHLVNYYASRQEIVFSQMVNDMPVISDDSILVFVLNGNDMIGYYQTRVSSIAEETKSRALVSCKEAVIALYLNSLLNDYSFIEQMALIYQKMMIVDNLVVYSPIWSIDAKKSDGNLQVLRVDALTNVPLRTTDKIN